MKAIRLHLSDGSEVSVRTYNVTYTPRGKRPQTFRISALQEVPIGSEAHTFMLRCGMRPSDYFTVRLANGKEEFIPADHYFRLALDQAKFAQGYARFERMQRAGAKRDAQQAQAAQASGLFRPTLIHIHRRRGKRIEFYYDGRRLRLEDASALKTIGRFSFLSGPKLRALVAKFDAAQAAEEKAREDELEARRARYQEAMAQARRTGKAVLYEESPTWGRSYAQPDGSTRVEMPPDRKGRSQCMVIRKVK